MRDYGLCLCVLCVCFSSLSMYVYTYRASLSAEREDLLNKSAKLMPEKRYHNTLQTVYCISYQFGGVKTVNLRFHY